MAEMGDEEIILLHDEGQISDDFTTRDVKENSDLTPTDVNYFEGCEFDCLDSVVTSIRFHKNLLHTSSLNGVVHIWDINTKLKSQQVELQIGDEPRMPVLCMEVIGDNRWATGSNNGSVFLWSQNSGAMTHSETQLHKHKVTTVREKSGKLFTAGNDGRFISFDINQNTVAHCFKACGCPIAAIAIAADTQIWTGTWDGKMRLLDLKSRQCAITLRTCISGESCVRDLCLHNDDNADKNTLFAAHGNGLISAWDIRHTASPLHRYPGHTEVVNSIAVSNNRVYSGSDDAETRIFDEQSCMCLDKLSGHTNAVNLIALHDDMMFTASFDSTIRRYNVSAIESAINAREQQQLQEIEEARQRVLQREEELAAEMKMKKKTNKKEKKGKKGKKAKA